MEKHHKGVADRTKSIQYEIHGSLLLSSSNDTQDDRNVCCMHWIIHAGNKKTNTPAAHAALWCWFDENRSVRVLRGIWVTFVHACLFLEYVLS
jgi:hypothetical protein